MSWSEPTVTHIGTDADGQSIDLVEMDLLMPARRETRLEIGRHSLRLEHAAPGLIESLKASLSRGSAA